MNRIRRSNSSKRWNLLPDVQRDLALASFGRSHLRAADEKRVRLRVGINRKSQKTFSAIVELGGVVGLHPLPYEPARRSDRGFTDSAKDPSQSKALPLYWKRPKRDRDAEGDFREGESSHFVLRYHGGASRQLASEVIHTLEDQFRVLKSELHYTPPEQIGVILYTQESFFDVTRVPGWAGGLNDGRIRVPVQGLETVSDLLARILKHELTHSFVFQKTGGRCPTWLQEGVAQWMEGRRTGGGRGTIAGVLSGRKRKNRCAISTGRGWCCRADKHATRMPGRSQLSKQLKPIPAAMASIA